DVLQPHRLYARQGWICAVVPADRTLDPVLELLELAYFDQRRRLGSALDSESAVREDRAPGSVPPTPRSWPAPSTSPAPMSPTTAALSARSWPRPTAGWSTGPTGSPRRTIPPPTPR